MKRLVAILIVAVAWCGILSVLPQRAQASTTPPWEAGYEIETLGVRSTMLLGHKCQKKTLWFQRLIKFPAPGSSPWTKTNPEEWCGYYGEFGFVAANRVAAQGDMKQGLYLRRTTQIPHHYPNNTTLLASQYFGSGAGAYQTISIKTDIFNDAPYIHYTTNSIDYYLGLHLDTSGGTLLRFGNGPAMQIKAFNVSESGEWVVVVAQGFGLFRINTNTLEVVGFSTDQRGSNVSDNSFARLSISNDGNTVLFADTNMYSDGRLRGQQAKLYDLSGCSNKTALDNLLSTSPFQTEGCSVFDLFSYIKQTYPSAYAVLDPWVHPTTNRIELRIAHRESGSPVAETLRLTAVNALSNTQGYLAMGDSFSSGEGDLEGGMWYEPGTDEQGNKETFDERNLCHLSRRSYPYLIAKDLGLLSGGDIVPVTPAGDGLFHSVACSGAKIHNVIGGFGEDQGPGGEDDFKKRDNQYRVSDKDPLIDWQPGTTTQINSLTGEVFYQSRSRDFSPEIITLGIGGNDAGFGDYVKACAMPGSCRYSLEGSAGASEVALRIALLKERLTDTYSQVKQSAPLAKIYVHGYPRFIATEGACGKNVPFDQTERRFIDHSVQYMNSIVSAAAAEAGVVYVSVENIFSGVNLCSESSQNDMAFNGITLGNDFNLGPGVLDDIYANGFCSLRSGCFGNESFHPNAAGHSLYAVSLLTQTNNFTLNNPTPQATATPQPPAFFGSIAQESVGRMNNKQLFDSMPTPSQLLTSDSGLVEVKYDGLLPGSTAYLTMFSDPIELGEFIVGSDGSLQTPFELPEEIEPGLHELHLSGINEFGETITAYEHLFVGSDQQDFDGDGVENSLDSCPTILNSFVDADADGIDDACDQELFVQQQGEMPSQEGEDKGVVSSETVAGREELAQNGQGQVLGAVTPSTGQVLAQTGEPILLHWLLGAGIIGVTALLVPSKHKKYSVR